MDRKTKMIAAGVLFGSAAVLGAFGFGAWLMVSQRTNVAGDLRTAAAGSYEPTSAWIEAGLDPNITTFGFEGSNDDAPRGPELDEIAIQQLVNAKQTDLMGCYAAALQEDDELQGKVEFRFGIAPDGHVAMVEVTDSTLRSTTTEDCMVAQARGWSFPPTNRSALMKFETDFTFVYE